MDHRAGLLLSPCATGRVHDGLLPTGVDRVGLAGAPASTRRIEIALTLEYRYFELERFGERHPATFDERRKKQCPDSVADTHVAFRRSSGLLLLRRPLAIRNAPACR